MQTRQRETIYFSRFPDVPPRPELVTIHERTGGYLVFAWTWTAADETWEQAFIGAPDVIEDARLLVPATAVALSFPAGFGLEAWEVA
jgi:hypothetical protein